MNFSEICKRQPAIATVISDAESQATRIGYYNAYVWGKGVLSYFVGMDAGDKALRSSRVYDVVIDELVEACERGDVEHEGPRKSILSLACKQAPPKEVLETKMLIGKVAFCLWLMGQGGRENATGALARDIVAFQGAGAGDVSDFLSSRYVEDSRYPALVSAYEEFRWGRGDEA